MSRAVAVAAVGALALLALGGGGEAAAAKPGPYGAAVVAAARKSIGVKETEPNNGPEIAAWAAELALSPPLQWCGVAVSHWLREAAAATGLPLVVLGAGRAKEILAQFAAKGRKLSAEQARAGRLPPGTVLVWDRATKPGGPEGHVGVLEVDNGPSWTTIEGNTEQGDVRRVERPKDDPRLLGAGLVDGPAAAKPGPSPSPSAGSGSTSTPKPKPGTGRVWVAGDSHANGLAIPLKKLLAPREVRDAGQPSTTIHQWTNPAGPGAPVFAQATASDLVLLSLGTNDLAAGVQSQVGAADAQLLVGVLKMRTPRIGWIGPPALEKWPGDGFRAYLVHALDEEGVPYLHSDFVDFERGADGIHGTPKGYGQWAAEIVQWAITVGLV